MALPFLFRTYSEYLAIINSHMYERYHSDIARLSLE